VKLEELLEDEFQKSLKCNGVIYAVVSVVFSLYFMHFYSALVLHLFRVQSSQRIWVSNEVKNLDLGC